MKGGKLPEIGADGKILDNAGNGGELSEDMTAFSRYMEDAMFLIPDPAGFAEDRDWFGGSVPA